MQAIKELSPIIRLSLIEGIFITAAFVFFVLTIKEGHDWGDDFAQYISHAKNIAEGLPYKNTGYIFNPNSWWIGPETYPPVFPLLLAGVYAIYGLDLDAMRIMILVCYLVFLVAFCIYSKDKLQGDIARISALLMVAFSPLYWDIKNSVISDIPFLMFFYLGLLLSDQITRRQQAGHRAVVAATAFGTVCYLAYGTRSVGLFLLVAFLIDQLYRRKRISAAAILSSLVFLALFVWQDIELHTDKSYIDPIEKAVRKQSPVEDTNYFDQLFRYILYLFNNLTKNLVLYLKEVKWFWEGGSNGIVGAAATVLTGLLCGFGLFRTLKEKITIGEVFFIVYSLFLLVMPFFQGTRYLLPIFPMYAIYIFKAFDSATQRNNFSFRQIANLVIIAAVTGIYVVNYLRIDYSPYRYGVGTKTSQELFKYIKSATPATSLIIFQKPRAMALFGERKSSSYHYHPGEKFEDAGIRKFLREIKATHVVVSNGAWGEEESAGYVEWAKTGNGFLVEKFRNADFSVYEIRPEAG